MSDQKIKKAKKIKAFNAPANKQRRIKKEIKKYQKKLDKLLRLHKEGRQRWTTNRKGDKIGLKVPKTQGIISGSKRHEGLLAHINNLKSQVQ